MLQDGQSPYTFKVVDSAGNELTGQTYSHTGQDNTAPTGATTAGSTGNTECLSAVAAAYSFDAAAAAGGYSDNCGGTVIATETGTEVITGSDATGWTVTYTFKVVDSAGNELTGQTYSHTGQDNTAPTGATTAGSTGNTECLSAVAAAYSFDAAAAAGGYSDNCGGTVIATETGTEVITGSDATGWTVTYTFKVVDSAGNELTGQTYSHTGQDNTAPTGATTAGSTGNTECLSAVAAAYSFDAAAAAGGYSDNCGGTVIATETGTEVITGSDATGWTVTYTFKVVDSAGNELTGQTYTHTGSDQTAPTGTTTAGSSGTDACLSAAGGLFSFDATAAAGGYTDNCVGVTAIETGTEVVTGDDSGWTVTYTFKVVDSAGNELTGQTYTHTGSDQTAPTGTTTAGSSGTNACLSAAGGLFSFDATAVAGGYTDNCVGVTAIETGTEVVTGDDSGWTVTYTFKVVDSAGNELTGQTYTHTGSDQTAPTGTTTAGSSGTDACLSAAAGLFSFDAVAVAGGYTDNCVGVTAIETGTEVVTGDDSGWTVTYTFKVVDSAGNELTGQTYTHTGSDQTAPTGTTTAGSSGTNACLSAAGGLFSFDATAAAVGYTDSCSVTAIETGTEVVTGDDSGWTVTYTFKVVDSAGNELTGQTYTHTGSDQTAPTGTTTAGSSGTDACLSAAGGLFSFDATAAAGGYTDNCVGVTAIETGTEVVTGDDSGWTVTYTFKVVDSAGNELTGQTYTHTGSDQTAPTGTTTAGSSGTDACLSAAAGLFSFDAVAAAVGYTDSCSVTAIETGTEVVTGDDSGWTVTYTFKVVDSAGNELTGQTYTHTGSDQTAPTVFCKNIILPLDSGTGLATITPSEIDNGSTDNCGSVNLSLDIFSFDCNDIGPNTVTLTVDDGNGNSVTCNATVTVTDAAENASVSIAASATTICENTSVTFTAIPVDGGASPSYQWQLNGGNVGTDSDTYSSSTLANADEVTVIMTSSLSFCATPVTPDASNIIIMTVNAERPVSFDISGPSAICIGDSATFSVNPAAIINGGASPTLQWTLNGSPIAGATNSTYSSSSLTNGAIIDLEVTSYVNCATPVPATSNAAITLTVNVFPTPVDAPFILCADEIATDLTTHDATVLDGETGTVAWYDGDPSGSGTLINPATAVNLNTVTDLWAEVTLTTGSCQASVDITVTINPLPTPVDAPFILCADEIATDLTTHDATVLDGETGTVAWYDGDPSGSGTLINPVTAVNLNTVTDLWAEVTLTTGSCQASVDITVTINPLPTPVDAPFILCADETSTDLTTNDATVLDGETGTVAWYDGDPSGSGTLINPATAVNLNSVTDLWAEVTLTTGSCQASVDVTVTINPLPTPVDAPFTLCADEISTDLTTHNATILDGETGTVAWYDGDPEGSGTLINPATAVNLNTVTDLWVEVTLTIGSCQASVDITVTINPLPTPVDAPFTLCADETSTDLTTNDATVLDGETGTVAWYDGDPSGSGTLINPATAVNLNTVTDLWAEVTLTTGSCQASVDITVTINPLPTPVDAPFTLCIDETSTNLTTNDTTVLDGETGTVAWYDGDPEGSGTLINPATAVNLNTITDLWAEVTLTTGSCQASVDITVTINPLPTVVANYTDIEICLGDTVTLTGSGATTYTWDNGVTDGVAFPPASTQTYTVTGTDGNGCINTNSITITVNPLPIVSAANNSSVCLGDNITLTADFTAGGSSVSAVSWSWTGPNGYSSAQEDPPAFAAVAASAGTYTVQITDNNGCVNTATTDIIVTPDATLSLSSGSDDQELCLDNDPSKQDPIEDIVYLVGGGGTGATVSGLPAGVTGSYNAGTGEYTISGEPTEAGIFNYTVSATECGSASLGGTIGITLEVNPLTPGAITGPTSICPPANGAVYSVPVAADPNRTHYVWVTPNGVDIVSGQGTREIVVNYTNTADHGGKDIKVKAYNSCKNSSEVKLQVQIGGYAYVNAGPDQEVCVGTTEIQQAGDSDGVIGGHDFIWDDGGAGGTFESDDDLTKKYFLPAGLVAGQVITLTITADKLGECEGGEFVVDDMTITVLADPTASISGDATICEGSNSNITFTGTANTTVTYTVNGGADQTIDIDGTGSVVLNTGALTATTTYDLVSVGYTNASTTCGTVALTGSATVTVDPLATADAGADQTVCADAPDITLSGSIGGGASSGTWSGGAGTFNPNDTTLNAVYTPTAGEITAGTVTLTLTTDDPSGPCDPVSDTMTITIDPSATVEAGPVQTVCADAPDATLAGSIGGAATTGTWSGGAGTFAPNATTLNAVYTPSAGEITTGTVTLTLTTDDPAGLCAAASDTMDIIIDPIATVDANVDQTVCADAPNITLAGSVGGVASSGTWTGGAGTFNPNATTLNAVYTPSAAEITAGTVTLTLTTDDPAGPCGAVSDTMTIIIDEVATVDPGVDQTVCSDAPDVTLAGSIGGGASSGTWSGGAGTFNPNATTLNAVYTPTAAEITAGTVTLTLTTDDPAGPCGAVSDTMTITINPEATVSAGADQTICSDGTATMAATIGSGLTGTWTSSGSGSFDNNSTTAIYTPSANDITSGSVTLTFSTNDPAGPCDDVNDAMILTIKEEVIITTPLQNVGVCVTSPATLSIVAVGDDLSYQWYHNGSLVSDTANISGSATNILSFANAELSDSGNYYVIVSGDASCLPVTSDTKTLNVNEEIDIDVDGQPVSATLCEGSNVTFTVTATGAIDTYQWYKVSSPDTPLSNGGIISGALSASLTLTGFSESDEGDYYVVITGPGGICPDVYSVAATLTVTENPTATISYDADPYCQEISTAQAVTITGTHAYTGGTFTAPAGLSIDANTGAITPNLSSGGTYLVTYTIPASGGCGIETTTTNVTIDNDPPVAVCQDITVQLDASGNVTITPAQIDNGSNDTCGIDYLSLDITTFDCTNIGANTVTLTVTDLSGNTDTCTATVTVEDNVAPIAICKDITVQLDASGNASILAADIDNNSYDVCGAAVSLSIPPTSFTCANLGANTVTLTVTDNYNNVATCDATVTVEDNVAPIAICLDITVQLDGSGNASIVAADIDNGSNDVCGAVTLSIPPTSFTCANLGANTVTLTVTDSNSNVATCDATVTVEDNGDPITPTLTNITWSCDYTPAIPTTTDVCDGTINGTTLTPFPITTTTTITWTFTDGSGNAITADQTINIVPMILTTTLTQSVTCNGDSDGAVTVSVVGGVGPYTYLWDDGAGQTTPSATGLLAGTYTVTVTDSNNCSSTDTVNVTEPDLLTGNASQDSPVVCYKETNGQATVVASGGSGGYTYLWDDGEVTATAINLSAGSHSVTITDSTGCTTSANVTITEPPVFVLSGSTSTAETCDGCNDITITAGTATGGNGGYQYSIDGVNYQASKTFTGLSLGAYTVFVRDSKGCITEDRITNYTSFAAGAAVIDMGIVPQNENNGLAPFGLVYDLVTQGIPVYWIVDPNKSFVDEDNIVNQIDLTVTGTTTRTGTTPITADLKTGPFIIAAEFMDLAYAIIEQWQTNRPGLTVYWNLDAIDDAPVTGIITNFPNVLVYEDPTKDIEVTNIYNGFYESAGITTANFPDAEGTLYRTGYPTNLTECDQIYVLSHHSDPDNWPQADIDRLYEFVIEGGDVWMGCHDISITESMLSTTEGNRFNFLSNVGLIPYKDLNAVSTNYPWLSAYADGNDKILKHDNDFTIENCVYDISAAGDPTLQFIGRFPAALHGNSEMVFLPFEDTGWRSTTTVALYDPTHTDLPAGTNRSNGEAALIAFGPAFGNTSFGDIFYQSGHIHTANSGTDEEWVAERRTYGNYLIQQAVRTSTQITINNLETAITVCDNEGTIDLDAVITAPYGNETYSWLSEIISGPGGALSLSPTNTNSTTATVPDVDDVTVYKVTLTITDTPDDGCLNPVIGKHIISISVLTANSGVDQILTECGVTTVSLSANDIENYTGLWTIVSGSGGSFTDASDSQTEFSGIVDETYTLRWTIDCATDDVIVSFSGNCATLDFDGIDDNVTFRDNYNFNAAFSVELWMKSEAVNGSNIQTIMSRRTDISSTTGYDLRLVNNIISFNWVDAGGSHSFSSGYAISTSRWYHLALTFDGSTYIMYIDGIEVGTASGSVPLATPSNVECILGAMDQNVTPPFRPINYFEGWMDELRVWNVTLNEEQIHQMMNQEIESNGTAVRGSVVPQDVSGLLWSNLDGYYQMNQPEDIVEGYVIPNAGSGDGRLRNITTWQEETAPLPYVSDNDGNWGDVNTTGNDAASPWQWGHSVWDYPNAIGVDGITRIDWNIVQIFHDIYSGEAGGDAGITLLGLLSETGELTVAATGVQDETNSGRMLWITHYLKLNGIIDLIGESQLLQKKYWDAQVNGGSELDVASGGHLERDQQGVGNLYRYSDWSSPVGNIGAGLLPSHSYTIPDVVRDGTVSSNPLTMLFSPNHNGSIGPPITISTRWIYAYKNQPGNYSDWAQLSISGTISAGEGFFFKGTKDPATDSNITYQNHVFIGKPHNADINVPIFPDMYYLTGNPYPCALDAQQFILDNLDSTSGVLYFWEHWGNDSHILADYQAGYTTYTIAGGVAAVNFNLNTTSPTNKIPGDYIPVAQGFYVNAYNSPGGNIKFNNNQRIYITEANAESTFFKVAKGKNKIAAEEPVDTRLKIRIGLETANILNKQILLTIDENATDGIDKGYDAEPFELLKNDIYWVTEGKKLVIQALGNLSVDQAIPFGMITEDASLLKIKVDTIENPYPNMEVYIRDNLTKDTYDIKNGTFEITLAEGEYNDKYSVVFVPKPEIPEEIEEVFNELFVFMSEDNKVIRIKRPEEMQIKYVALYNVLGQRVNMWYPNMNVTEIDLPVYQNTGVYFVMIATNSGTISKKVVIE